MFLLLLFIYSFLCSTLLTLFCPLVLPVILYPCLQCCVMCCCLWCCLLLVSCSVVCLFILLFFFYCYGDHRDLHLLTLSFPTRRSSDLGKEDRRGPGGVSRALHRSRRDGQGHPLGPARHHRLRPAIHRRSLAAAQDRRRPRRRDLRMHRLQHLHLALQHEQHHRLHAESDGDGGVSARLAPGAIRTDEVAQGSARGGRRPVRPRMRARPWLARDQ